MGGQQSQQLNQQQQLQQPEGRRQHHQFHHFLTRRPSIGHHLERRRSSTTPFPMNKIYRSSSQSYPYPRTHTLVVVPPTRPIIEDDPEENFTKTRPPLNRAIPPIPESKSNDSIMTHVSERHSDAHAEPVPSTSRAVRQPSRIKPIGQAAAPPTARDPPMSSREMDSDGSLVIENRMAQNLATKTAVIVSTRTRRSEDVPRSPLMSVAHSVRTKLTKLGNRFSRSDGNQNIRTSTSLSSMRRGPVDKMRDVPSNTHFKKSASMETRTALNSTSMDSIKTSIPSRHSPGSGAPGIPRIPGARSSTNDHPPAELYEKSLLLNQNRSSKLARPKNLPPRSTNSNTKANCSVQAFKVHLEPRTAQIISQPDITRKPVTVVSAVAPKVRTSTDHQSVKEIKEARIKPTMNAVAKNDEDRQICSSQSNMETQNNENDQMKAMSTSRQRSFIPLYTTPPRRLPARTSRTKTGRAPLAECESSCIENSPAVEVPPVKFIPDKSQDMCVEKNPEVRATESQSPAPTATNSSANSVRGDQNDQFLSTESTLSNETRTRKQSTNGDKGNGWTASDVVVLPDTMPIDNNSSPNVPSGNGACDSDAKSGNSPNEFVSPTAMTSSGFTTSSGFQDSPDKSPDKDAEFDEQFSDMTVIQKAGRSRSRRPPPRDLDRESVVSTNSISTHYKSVGYDEAPVNKANAVAFPNVAMYESSCNDVAYIKSQLLELQTLINNSVEAECLDKTTSKKMEDNDVVVQRLLEENDALRKELMEKDRIISNLKAQILLH